MIMADQPLGNQALLERSLRRSAQLGRQVLDRASRRRGAAGDQAWWSRPSGTTGRQSQSTPSTTPTSVQRTCLDSAFETIAEFMAHTTDQCKNVYQPDCCSDPTEMERSHVRRFHSHPSTRTDPTEMERSHVRRFHSHPSTRTDPTEMERSHVRRFHSHPSTRTDPTEMERSHVCRFHSHPSTRTDPTEMERSHVRRFHSHPSTRTDPTEMERSHVCRFHSHPSTRTERSHVRRFHSHPSTRTATPALTKRIQGQVSGGGEDFHIEVSPGTYSITAGMQDAVQQTQTVSVHAGESINLTFNL